MPEDVSFWWMPICAAHRCHENMLQILLDRSSEDENRGYRTRSRLADADNVTDRLLGVVLNKVDTPVQSRYELYHGNKYHQKYYAKYGYLG